LSSAGQGENYGPSGRKVKSEIKIVTQFAYPMRGDRDVSVQANTDDFNYNHVALEDLDAALARTRAK